MAEASASSSVITLNVNGEHSKELKNKPFYNNSWRLQSPTFNNR